MQDTLTYGYFEMLGVLSKRKEGLEYVHLLLQLRLICLTLPQTARKGQAVHRFLPLERAAGPRGPD